MLADLMSSLNDFFSSSNLVPLGVAVIAVFFLMSSLRKKQQARSQAMSKASPRREPSESMPARKDLRRDIDALLVELQELSRRISAEIDVRFAKLEVAMRDADRRIAALNRLTHQEEAKSPDEQESSDVDQDIRHAIVYELADQGYSPVEIARDLGKTPGEVELILNLRKQTRAGDKSGGE